jgi:hypothetical protein
MEKLKVMFPPDMVAFWNMFIADSGLRVTLSVCALLKLTSCV